MALTDFLDYGGTNDVSAADEAREVELIYQGNAKTVEVLGNFNNWLKNVNPLKEVEPAVWKTVIALPPGNYPYKFLANDKDWVLGPGEIIKDYSGNVNNLLVVGGEKRSETKIFTDLVAIRKIMNELHSMLGFHQTSLKIVYSVSSV